MKNIFETLYQAYLLENPNPFFGFESEEETEAETHFRALFNSLTPQQKSDFRKWEMEEKAKRDSEIKNAFLQGVKFGVKFASGIFTDPNKQ